MRLWQERWRTKERQHGDNQETRWSVLIPHPRDGYVSWKQSGLRDDGAEFSSSPWMRGGTPKEVRACHLADQLAGLGGDRGRPPRNDHVIDACKLPLRRHHRWRNLFIYPYKPMPN
jgi:hypothetical protein